MKMRLSDRLLIALYALFGLTLLVLAAFYAWMPASMAGAFNTVVAAVRETLYLKIIAVLLGVVMLTWTARVFMLAFEHEPAHDRSSVSLQRTEHGTVRVSVAAMDTLVRQAIGLIEGMTEIKTKIINHDDSITIKIDMALSGEVHIPNTTMLMQRNVKKSVEEHSGIAVREVEIVISSIRPAEPALLAIEQRVAPAEADAFDRLPDPADEARPADAVEPVEAKEPIPELVVEPEDGASEGRLYSWRSVGSPDSDGESAQGDEATSEDVIAREPDEADEPKEG